MPQRIPASFFQPSYVDAVEQLLPVLRSVTGDDVVVITCLEEDVYVTETEFFRVPSGRKSDVPAEELFALPTQLHATAVAVTSTSSGPIEELHEADLEFTRHLAREAHRRGIRLAEHFLVQGDMFRVMSESMSLDASSPP
ncbi:MAG: JAB domain-containing protein [Actinomycetota bacterium]